MRIPFGPCLDLLAELVFSARIRAARLGPAAQPYPAHIVLKLFGLAVVRHPAVCRSRTGAAAADVWRPGAARMGLGRTLVEMLRFLVIGKLPRCRESEEADERAGWRHWSFWRNALWR